MLCVFVFHNTWQRNQCARKYVSFVWPLVVDCNRSSTLGSLMWLQKRLFEYAHIFALFCCIWDITKSVSKVITESYTYFLQIFSWCQTQEYHHLGLDGIIHNGQLYEISWIAMALEVTKVSAMLYVATSLRGSRCPWCNPVSQVASPL